MKTFICSILFFVNSINLLSSSKEDFTTTINKINESLSRVKTVTLTVNYYASGDIKRDEQPFLSNILYAIKKNEPNSTDSFYYKVFVNNTNDNLVYSIHSPTYRATVSPFSKTIDYIEYNGFQYDDIVGLFLGQNIEKYLEMHHIFNSVLEPNADINADPPKVDDCVYLDKPCFKIAYKYHYTGILKKGSKNSEATVEFVFDKETNFPLLYTAHIFNYDDDVNQIISELKIKHNYKYLQINEGFPPEYFDYKHLLGLGYTLNVEK